MTTLSDITELIIDSEHKTAPTVERGYPYVRTPNIGRGYLILDNVRSVSERSYKEWTKRAVPQKDDLILAREAPIGNVAIVSENLKLCLGQRTVLIRPDKRLVNPRYLMFLLLWEEIQHKFHSYSSGATVPHLNMRDIRNLKLPNIPPMDIQNKIANVLGHFYDLFEFNIRRINILKEIAQNLYHEWFVRLRYPGSENVEKIQTPHGPSPKDWEWKKLGDFVELAYGKELRKKDRIPGDYPVYGSSGIVGFHNEYLVEGPGIIVGRAGNFGRVYWSNRNFCPIDSVFYVVTSLSLYYLYYNLQHQNFVNVGVAVPMLSRNQAYVLPLLVPDQDILEKFERIIKPIFTQIDVLNLKNEVLIKIRELLLPMLISGKIAVSDLRIRY